MTRATPGRFRARIITEGVTPSLHVDYKHSRIKQYHKEGRALRTETTINDTRDFSIGKRLKNLPALRLIGFQANRRLLHVQHISHNCLLGKDAFQQVSQPQTVSGQRVPALRFSDPRVHALLSALVAFRLLPQGFANHELRGAARSPPGLRPRSIDPRANDLSLATAAPAWTHPTHSQHASLPDRRLRLAHIFLLYPPLRQSDPSRLGTDRPSSTSAEPLAAPPF